MRSVQVRSLALAAGFLLLVGCSQEEVTEALQGAVGQTQQAVSQGIQQAQGVVEQQVGNEGQIDLAGPTPVVAAGCYAHFDVLGPHASVLRLSSYSSPETETFPAVLLHASTTAATPSELVGQTLAVRLFVARSEAEVWSTPLGATLPATVVSVAGSLVTVELAAGELVDAAGRPLPISGRLVGQLP